MRFTHDTTEYELTFSHDAKKGSKYLELLELGGLRPRPVMFAFRNQATGAIFVSMHKEGLAYAVFRRFTAEIEKKLVHAVTPQ